MAKHTRRWAPLLLALVLLALCLVACQAPGSADAQGKTGKLLISTAVAGSSSPTPTLPPFTIGVWTSPTTPTTPTPGARESLTIYVLCIVQDPARGGPIGPAVGLQLGVRLSGPITQSFTATTGRDGLAQVRVSFAAAHPGKPVTVDVVTTWQGVTYQEHTFLMLGAGGVPTPTPTPSPAATSSPATSPTPGPKPTATPAPKPTATTAPKPTATTGP
jgi:hypothetical protein